MPGPSRALHRPTLALAAALLALAMVGCGGDEGRFEAEEFTEIMQRAGAPLSIGPELVAADESIEVRVIDLEPDGGGTILRAESEERARNEFARCETALSLVCFRAANVVLRFDELSDTQRAQVTAALQEIEAASQAE